MGLFKKVMAAGVAKKVYDEARKPHNQKRMKDAYASFQARRSGRQPPSGPPTGTTPRPQPPTGSTP